MRTPALILALGAAGCLTLGACKRNADGTDPTGSSPTYGDGSVRGSLEALGVDTAPGGRLDAEGNALPVSYTPFGSREEFGRLDELMIVGAQPAGASGHVAFVETETGSPVTLYTPSPDPVWGEQRDGSERFPASTRAGTAGDVDGDGIEEGMVVFVDTDDPLADEEVVLETIDDAVAGTPFARATQVLTLQAGVVDIAAAAADLDGDSFDGAVIGLSTDTAAFVVFARNAGGTVSVDDVQTIALTPDASSDDHGLRVVTGNIDYDPAEESVVIMNEVTGSTGGRARYWIYDDAGAGFAELDSGTLDVFDGTDFRAVQMDAAIGDIDGDYVGEIVLGGLGGYLGSECGDQDYLGLALDDVPHGLAEIGSYVEADAFSNCDAFNPLRMRFAYVNTLDLDGDRVQEVAIHTKVFDNWRDDAPFTLLHEAADGDLVDSGDNGYLDRNTFVITAGNLDGDITEDLILYSQDQARLYSWGLSPKTGSFGRVFEMDMVLANSQTPSNPILVPINLDEDTAVLAYGDAVQNLVFTEPIVIAALAAAPCFSDESLGQYLLGCGTQFGTAESTTVTREQTVSVSASASVGVNVDGGAITQSEFEFKATLTATASAISGQSYELSKSVVYTNASFEDTVVFTTVPYDQYIYRVLSHPDPDLVGSDIVVSLPREPITLMAEVPFYNQTVPEGALTIGEEVFSHTGGDPTTYLSVAEKNQRITDANLQNGPVSVGQGTGNAVDLGIEVGQEIVNGSSFGVGYEVSVEVTGGTVLGGFSVGGSVDNTLTVSMGESTVYGGGVGSLPAGAFGDNQYSFGVFTHIQSDAASGQEFQVVNFWVE